MEVVQEQDGDKADTKAATAKGDANAKKRPVEKQEGSQKVRSEIGEPPIALSRIDLAPSPFGTTQSDPHEIWLPFATTPHKASPLCSCSSCKAIYGAKTALSAGGPLSANAGHSGSSSGMFWPSIVGASLYGSPPGLPNPAATQGTFGSRFSSAGQLGATGIRFSAGRPTLVFPTSRPPSTPLFGSAPKPTILPATDGFQFGPGPFATTGLFGFGPPEPPVSGSTPFGPPSSSVLGAHQPFSGLFQKPAAPESTKLSLSDHLQLAASRFPKTLGSIPSEGLMNAALPTAPINNENLAYAQVEPPATDRFKYGTGLSATTGLFGHGAPVPNPVRQLRMADEALKTLGPIHNEGFLNTALPTAPINNDYLAYAQAEYAKMEGNGDTLEATAERIGANWLRLDDATRRMYEISVVLIEPQGPAWAAAMKRGLLLAMSKLINRESRYL